MCSQHLTSGYIPVAVALVLYFVLARILKKQHHVSCLWAIEKNVEAIRFYDRHDFHVTNKKKFEEGTTEYLVMLERSLPD